MKRFWILNFGFLITALLFADATRAQSVEANSPASHKAADLIDAGAVSSNSPSQATPKPEKPDEYATAGAAIEKKCAADWPDDYDHQVYCQQKQNEAVAKLRKGRPADISQPEYATVHRKCARDWPDDYDHREYCESKQFEALRKLRDNR